MNEKIIAGFLITVFLMGSVVYAQPSKERGFDIKTEAELMEEVLGSMEEAREGMEEAREEYITPVTKPYIKKYDIVIEDAKYDGEYLEIYVDNPGETLHDLRIYLGIDEYGGKVYSATSYRLEIGGLSEFPARTGFFISIYIPKDLFEQADRIDVTTSEGVEASYYLNNYNGDLERRIRDLEERINWLEERLNRFENKLMDLFDFLKKWLFEEPTVPKPLPPTEPVILPEPYPIRTLE